MYRDYNYDLPHPLGIESQAGERSDLPSAGCSSNLSYRDRLSSPRTVLTAL